MPYKLTHYKFLLLYFLLPAPVNLAAATINDIRVTENGSYYTMYAEAVIRADTDIVMRLISDYENLVNINPYLLESYVLNKSKDGLQRVSMLTRACVMMVCYKLRHVQNFTQQDVNVIYGEFIPELSDFSYGWTRWSVTRESLPHGVNSTLIIELEIEPDFFILPVIGPELLKKKLIEITSVTINNLEAAARSASR